MKQIHLTLSIIMISSVLAVAQEQQTQTFTLEQCIQYALENSDNIKNSKLDEAIAKARVKETRGIGLPQIDASVNLMQNVKLQRFFNTSAVVSSFLGGQEIEGTAPTDVVAAGSPFQLKSSGTAALNATQILFNGSYLVGLRAANAYKDLSVKTSQQTKEELIVQVTKAYYTTLVNSERMELFDSNIARVDSLLNTTRALHENGFAESIDVDRIRVTLNNLKTERENFKNLQVLSTELLKFQMNFPMENELTIAGSLEDIVIPESADYADAWDYSIRPDFQVMMANKKLQELNIKNQYAAGLPSLVAFGTYGYSTQSADIAGLFKTETNPNANFPQDIGPDKWYSYSNFGVTLSVPLFSGLQRSYRVQQAKLDLQKIENGISTLKDGIDLEIKQSSAIYENSLKTLVSQRENMELAENVARVTKIKYEQGVGSNIEVIDAESSLKEAQINYYNALYDALVAKVDLDKAYGKLLNPQTSQENK